jgi:hypothetical protein
VRRRALDASTLSRRRYAGFRASRIAGHTRSPVAGISNSFTPSGAKASMMAFMTAGKAPTVPASPAPFTPRGFNFVGAGLLPTSIAHTSSARGTQVHERSGQQLPRVQVVSRASSMKEITHDDEL